MRKLIMLIPMLLAANSALAETTFLNGDEASEAIRKGTVIAEERSVSEWNLLVDYRGLLFKCEVLIHPGTGKLVAMCMSAQ